MGWSDSPNEIFDEVAEELVNSSAGDGAVQSVASTLIRQLQLQDWDTEHDSLEKWQDEPAIVRAFAENDIILKCGHQDEYGNECERPRGHGA